MNAAANEEKNPPTGEIMEMQMLVYANRGYQEIKSLMHDEDTFRVHRVPSEIRLGPGGGFR